MKYSQEKYYTKRKQFLGKLLNLFLSYLMKRKENNFFLIDDYLNDTLNCKYLSNNKQ